MRYIVGNAVLSVPSENSTSMGEFSAGFLIAVEKWPLRGQNAEDSVPYGGAVSARYSVLNATTGSFRAALRLGMMPANILSSTLMATSTAATGQGR